MNENVTAFKENTYEDFIKPKYDALISNEINDYCLLAITLKNFPEYCHSVGHQHRDAIISLCEQQLRSCLNENEYLVHMHYNCFLLLVYCPATLDSLHPRAIEFHLAVRDETMNKYKRKLFLKLGFFPIIKKDVDFYEAEYFAFLSQQGQQNLYPETNYDMYYISFKDDKEAFYKLESKVQSALKNGDFKLYLQPKVDLKTGLINCGEALMRWVDPDTGVIPLQSFLPSLEENGNIRDVDLYLFEKGCQYIEKWKKQYHKDIQISFNLSNAYFTGNYFFPEYKGVFEKYDIESKSICIELLESVVLNELNQLNSVVSSIHDLGFECSLDDFGSGFSSFDILANTSLTELKLDRSLFQDFDNEKERVLVKYLIELAHKLDMRVVSEGIETKEYAEYLSEIGCDLIQGFYYYRPMPIEEFEERFVK